MTGHLVLIKIKIWFIKIFIMGLKGDWQGINFSGCDDPTYRDE